MRTDKEIINSLYPVTPTEGGWRLRSDERSIKHEPKTDSWWLMLEELFEHEDDRGGIQERFTSFGAKDGVIYCAS